ncbi:MAG TPA: FAD-dependent oxidoreductase [Nitrospirota bacterium]|nr:FAD-dependent oxidoreductase [Nitrospirota bacterium]
MSTSCDVLVVGAGVSGAAAAVAAARGGARTILVEKESYLGGTGFAGRFQYICGLYLNADAVPTETLNPGITREISGLLFKASPGKDIRKIGQVYGQPYRHNDLQSVLTSLCSGESAIATLREHAVVAVTKNGSEVTTVTIEGLRGRQDITPKVVIDCSGSGEAAALAGASFELAPKDERQLAGFVVHVKGLKHVDESLSLKVPYHLAQAVKQGIFPHEVKFTIFSPGDAVDEGFCKMSLFSTDEATGTEQARTGADAVIRHLASVLPAFEGAYIADTSLRVLEREGRRITGAYTLTKEDVLSARKFPDGVVKNAWPIELWDRAKGTIYKYVPRGEYYEIPFRCLLVSGITNLLTAGRCISVTHEALGSTRVMGACMALGEQAGKAAAYRARNGKYPENIKDY